MVIPYTLREKIETTRVDVDGHDCPLRLDSAAGRPLFEPEIAEVTVSTDYGGSRSCATVDVRVSSLDDEEYVLVARGECDAASCSRSAGPRDRYRINCPPLTSIVSPAM